MAHGTSSGHDIRYGINKASQHVSLCFTRVSFFQKSNPEDKSDVLVGSKRCTSRSLLLEKDLSTSLALCYI